MAQQTKVFGAPWAAGSGCKSSLPKEGSAGSWIPSGRSITQLQLLQGKVREVGPMSHMLGETFKMDPVELKTRLEGGKHEKKMDHGSCFPLLQPLPSAPCQSCMVGELFSKPCVSSLWEDWAGLGARSRAGS